MSFDPYSLVASILFSIIGFGALGYGRKLGLWQPSAIGVVLMVYSYFIPASVFFVSGTVLNWLIGSGLCVLLWFHHYE